MVCSQWTSPLVRVTRLLMVVSSSVVWIYPPSSHRKCVHICWTHYNEALACASLWWFCSRDGLIGVRCVGLCIRRSSRNPVLEPTVCSLSASSGQHFWCSSERHRPPVLSSRYRLIRIHRSCAVHSSEISFDIWIIESCFRRYSCIDSVISLARCEVHS